MKKLLLGLSALPFLIGVASAAESLKVIGKWME
jgi:hypothetical protein